MHEIKFRAKRKDNGKWVYGYLFYRYYSLCIQQFEPMPPTLSNPGGDIDHYSIYEVDSETVGQYIDERDKDNREIYEGDIVKVNTGINIRVRKVIFTNGMFCIRGECSLILLGRHSMDRAPVIEVLGNIYDDSNLTKKEN